MPESPPGGASATSVAIAATETLALFIPPSGNLGPTVIGQVPPSPGPVPALLIRGVANVSIGGTAGAVVIKCRRGNGTGGTQVGAALNVYCATASEPYQIAFAFSDDSNPSPQGGYSITLTNPSAGTCNLIVGSIDDGS